MVAALYVQTGGAYFGLPDVDPWDEARDARTYAGPHPVVAHPPCSRWCQLAGLNQHRYGHRVGDDGGCFAAALAAVRRWGGVLEHPAYSEAWPAFDLPVPHRAGGWQRGTCGGWACQVEQIRYGHRARKATWLYVYGIDPPPLRWGYSKKGAGALVSFCSNKLSATDKNDRPRLTKKQASQSPPEFRDMLIALARSARRDP